MQSVWSGGDDRLSGAALSQTSSVSALSPLPALEVALSRSECKLFTSHVYLISLFVCLFFLSWRWRKVFVTDPSTWFCFCSVSSLKLGACQGGDSVWTEWLCSFAHTHFSGLQSPTFTCTRTAANMTSYFFTCSSGGRWGFTTRDHHSSAAASRLAAWGWLSNPLLELLS